MSTFMAGSLQVAMNELSNHDHSRFLTRTNRRVGRIHTLGPEAANEDVNKGIFRQAVVFQMTWPGAPTIYYGDEAGVAGWTDPDSRRTYPWGHEDHDLINFHREMIRIHKQYDALMKGSLVQIHSEFKCIAYGRFTRKQAVAVVINSDYNDKKLHLHIRHMGVPNNRTMRRIMLTTEEGYSIDSQTVITQNNQMSVVVPKMSAVVYVCNMD
jgi:alpha-glucosidase